LTVYLTEKGGALWETKAGKKIKTKIKSRKPTNRLKRIKGGNSWKTFLREEGEFHPVEADLPSRHTSFGWGAAKDFFETHREFNLSSLSYK